MPFNWLKRRGDPPYKDPKTAGGREARWPADNVPDPEAISHQIGGKNAHGLAQVSGSDEKFVDMSYGENDWDAFMNPASNPARSVFARSEFTQNPKPGTSDPYGGGWE
jgi:hypothetical protein